MAITIKNGAKVLYQWERGVALTVTAPCDVLRVSREEEQRSVDLFPTWSGNTGTVLIPDRMLTESGYLRAARIDKGDGEERVMERVRIIIRAAQKPENDASSQREIRDWEELRIRMAALERAAREGKFDGEDGTTPHIGENGNWYIGDTDTEVNAKGDDGLTPHIGENGNWFIGETDTGVKAKGDDGLTPHIGESGNWYIGGIDTGVKAKGDDGIAPHIGENGNWFIGDTDTGVKARSENVSEYAQDLVTNGVYVADDPDAMLCKPVEGTDANNPIRFRAEPGVLYVNGVRKKVGTAAINMKSPETERIRAFGYRLYEETGVIKQIVWDVEITTGADGNEIITAIGYDPDFISAVLPVREGGIYDILIYTVTVPAGATQATQDMIRDLRGDERYCGFVRSKLAEDGGGASVEIDDTLTVPGAAADAAAVGAELKNKYSTENEPPYPVTSVCGKTGAVSLAAEDVGADKSGTADGKVSAHNTSEASHNDIRLLISGLTTRLNALADSDDTTLDQLSEIVEYIKANKTLIDSITTSKVNVADIIDNLTTSVSNKPLSAKMGTELKKLIDAIEIPTSLPASDVYDWAKQPSKPTYTKNEVGLGNVDNVRQYSASNPPPYPVTSVNGQTGAVSVTADGIGAASNERVDQLSETISNLQISGLTTAQVNALDIMFKAATYTEDVTEKYAAFKAAFGIGSGDGVEDANILYKWDFTKSMTDSVGGITATTNGTRTDKGVSFDAVKEYIELLSLPIAEKTVEIDIAEGKLTPSTINHSRLFCMNVDTLTNMGRGAGFTWRYNNQVGWTVYSGHASGSSDVNGTWNEISLDSTQYPIDFFDGKTLRLEFGTDGDVKVSYALIGTDVFTEIQQFPAGSWQVMENKLIIGGSQDNALYPITISGIRIYKGV